MENQVTRFFEEKGFALTPLFTGEDTATVASAAAVLGVEEGMIAKSLGLRLKEKEIVLVVCGHSRIDNRKYKDAFGCKAKMMTAEETVLLTGFPVGGVCPFALPEGVEVYLDISLKQYETVYPAAGTRDSAVEVQVDKLPFYTGGSWIDVCKDAQEENSENGH